MTHWNEDDLAGRLLAEMRAGGEQWLVIRMPAIAEEDEVWRAGAWEWRRKAGEALWPQQWPLAKLDAVREHLRLSIRGMRAWLRDPAANLAVIEDFEKAEDLRICRWCNFRAVCRPEL